MNLRAVLLLVVFAFPSIGSACTVCFGAPGSAESEAASWAIGFLLAVITGVLGVISAFGFYLYRRAKNPLPEHQAFTDALEP